MAIRPCPGPGWRLICVPQIVKNGRVIRPKNGTKFCFWVRD